MSGLVRNGPASAVQLLWTDLPCRYTCDKASILQCVGLTYYDLFPTLLAIKPLAYGPQIRGNTQGQ